MTRLFPIVSHVAALQMGLSYQSPLYPFAVWNISRARELFQVDAGGYDR